MAHIPSGGCPGHFSLIVKKLEHSTSLVYFDTARDINTLSPRQDGRHFPDAIFKCIFSNVNVWIPIKISMKFVPKDPINNIPALVQIMAWCRPGDKPLSEPMMVSLLTHICVTRPQWVNHKMWLSKSKKLVVYEDVFVFNWETAMR